MMLINRKLVYHHKYGLFEKFLFKLLVDAWLMGMSNSCSSITEKITEKTILAKNILEGISPHETY